jgi:hypothetical protein
MSFVGMLLQVHKKGERGRTVGTKVPGGMPFGDVLLEFRLNGESGMTSLVDVRTGVGWRLGVFFGYVGA